MAYLFHVTLCLANKNICCTDRLILNLNTIRLQQSSGVFKLTFKHIFNNCRIIPIWMNDFFSFQIAQIKWRERNFLQFWEGIVVITYRLTGFFSYDDDKIYKNNALLTASEQVAARVVQLQAELVWFCFPPLDLYLEHSILSSIFFLHDKVRYKHVCWHVARERETP